MSLTRDGRVLATLCYVMDGDRVLMLKRGKEPNLGLFTAPGGRFEWGESPVNCVKREIFEETGLMVKNLNLKAIISESGPFGQERSAMDWLLFVFRTSDFSGQIIDCDEGQLHWLQKDKLVDMEIPQADKIFTPIIFEKSDDLRLFEFKYDEEGKLSQHEFYQGE